MHLLIDREDLLSAAGAFGLDHGWLQHFKEHVVVVVAKRVEKFL
jgi:hypothetical protein